MQQLAANIEATKGHIVRFILSFSFSSCSAVASVQTMNKLYQIHPECTRCKWVLLLRCCDYNTNCCWTAETPYIPPMHTVTLTGPDGYPLRLIHTRHAWTAALRYCAWRWRAGTVRWVRR